MRPFWSHFFIIKILFAHSLVQAQYNMGEVVAKTLDSCTSSVSEARSTELGMKFSSNWPANERQKMDRVINRLAEFPKVATYMKSTPEIQYVQNLTCGGVQNAAGCTGPQGFRLSPAGDGMAWNSLPHEMGMHVLSAGGFRGSFSKIPTCTFNQRMEDAMNNTKGDKVYTGGKTPYGELFAESFSAYVFAPDLLKRKCPAYYDFMKSNVYGLDNSQSCAAGSILAGGAKARPGVNPYASSSTTTSTSNPVITPASSTPYDNVGPNAYGSGLMGLGSMLGGPGMGSMTQLLPVILMLTQKKDKGDNDTAAVPATTEASSAVSEVPYYQRSVYATGASQAVTNSYGGEISPPASQNAQPSSTDHSAGGSPTP